MAETRTYSQSELMADKNGRELRRLNADLEEARSIEDSAERRVKSIRDEIERVVQRMGGNVYAMGIGLFAVVEDGTRTIVDPDRVRDLQNWARSNNDDDLVERVERCFVQSEYTGGLRITPEEHMRDESIAP